MDADHSRAFLSRGVDSLIGAYGRFPLFVDMERDIDPPPDCVEWDEWLRLNEWDKTYKAWCADEDIQTVLKFQTVVFGQDLLLSPMCDQSWFLSVVAPALDQKVELECQIHLGEDADLEAMGNLGYEHLVNTLEGVLGYRLV